MKNKLFKHGDISILPILVLENNYVYLVFSKKKALLIDVGEAEPVVKALEHYKLKLEQILITHHHYDHIGGWAQMQEHVEDDSKQPFHEIEAIATPGHMKEHLIYYLSEVKALFSGDILINGGCGRIMEGTALDLFNSLNKICSLPDDTRIFGGHDYLEENLTFGLKIEPENEAIRDRLKRYHKKPHEALFVTLAEEKATNVFLRTDNLDHFTQLRKEKDAFSI